MLPEDDESHAAVFCDAQYYSQQGLCRAARPLQERVITVTYSEQSGQCRCEMYNPLQGLWERMDVDTGAWSDQFLVCAGDGCLIALAAFFRFRPASGGWELIVSTIPIPVFISSLAYRSGCLYRRAGTIYMHSINLSTGQCELLPLLSTRRAGATSCAVDGRLFVIGGGTASVDAYVAPERRWVSVPDMPIAVWFADAVALEQDGG